MINEFILYTSGKYTIDDINYLKFIADTTSIGKLLSKLYAAETHGGYLYYLNYRDKKLELIYREEKKI